MQVQDKLCKLLAEGHFTDPYVSVPLKSIPEHSLPLPCAPIFSSLPHVSEGIPSAFSAFREIARENHSFEETLQNENKKTHEKQNQELELLQLRHSREFDCLRRKQMREFKELVRKHSDAKTNHNDKMRALWTLSLCSSLVEVPRKRRRES